MRFLNAFVAVLVTSVVFSGCTDKGPATAQFVATPLSPDKSKYQFDASTSTGAVESFSWDFGDGTEPAAGKVAEHTYQYLNGKYAATLTVTGKDGKTASTTQQVQVGTGTNSDPILFLTTDTRWVKPGEEVLFDATQSYDADGDPIHFEWDFNSQLADADYNNMENLGGQRYGRYKFGAPPGGEAPAATEAADNSSGGLLTPTPSGYVWEEEYEKAQARVDDALSPYVLHVGGTPEPRNTDFDGKIDDTSPIQLYAFPSPATYYVLVRVVDVKGTSYEGFIRIRAAETVPEQFVTLKTNETMLKSSKGELANEQFPTRMKLAFQSELPLKATAILTYTEDASGAPLPLTMSMQGWVCGASIDVGQCRTSSDKKTPWPSGDELVYEVGVLKVGQYQVLVENSGDMPVKATLTINLNLDLNPWFLDDSGNVQGH